MNRESLNVSMHVPVKSIVHVSIDNQSEKVGSLKSKSTRKVLSWNKIDQERYLRELKNSLPSDTNNTEVCSSIVAVMDCLLSASKKSVPSKTVKLKGPKKKASQKLLECISKVKATYREWTAAGKPNTGHLYTANKLAKRVLRGQQRVEETVSRKAFYNSLMENPSSTMFYRLIRKSKSPKEESTSCILVDGVTYTDPDSQRKCFAQYYEDLAVPKDNDYDNAFLKLCNIRGEKTLHELSNSSEKLTFSESDIEKVIDKLHNGKSPDEYGISAEHFKAGKSELVPVITKIFNQILDTKTIPPVFKTGVITPVLKKGKDPKLLENYRGITVTAIFGKLFEYALLHKLSIAQSELQFGFTEGLSPSMAALLISEAKAESQVNKTHVYVATLDSMKAFDVVHHAILLDKLTQTNIHDTSWLVIRDLYQQISAKVKLLGGLSDSFPIGQGVRQGAILSTSLYKVYIDELLRILKSKRLGLRIGTVYIGCPTCADDIALLALTPEELQIMIYEALNYSKKNRYQIHPSKSNVVDISVYKLNEDLKWFLGENPIRLSERAIHLGITRAGKGESVFNVNDRISLARRTSYSLMNTGLHGTNGLSPEASYVIYRAYVLPRLLYGLEVLSLTQGQLDLLSRYHIQTLRNIQSLPQRTASAAVYMLLGALPLEAELHKRRLSLLNSVITSDNECLRGLIQRQLACAFNIQTSFFYIVSDILKMYGLPSLTQLVCKEYSKLQWKHIYVKAVNKFWLKRFISEIKTKSTLKYLPVENLRIGSAHLVWRSLDPTVADVRKGITKARILTGTYLLQSNRHKFSGGTVDPVCRHCRLEDEDLLHVLARCPAYFDIRSRTVKALKDTIVRKTNLHTWSSYAKDWTTILKTLVCAEVLVKALPAVRGSEDEIERISRDCFHKIHIRKLQLDNLDGSGKMVVHRG